VRRHPDRVRALAVQGVAPPSRFTSLAVPRNAQRALEATLDACEQDPSCRSAFPRVRAQLDSVLKALEASPVEVSVSIPGDGSEISITMTRDLFAGVLRFLLYDTRLAARIPAIVEEAGAGDFDTLFRLAIRFAEQLGGMLYTGAVLSAFCTEDVDRFSERDVLEAAKGTFLGPALVLNLKHACNGWPRGKLPADFHDPVTFDGPVLLLSGEFDPITPPSWAEEAAKRMSNGRHVVLAGAGHFLPDACVRELLSAFFEAGSAENLDVSCARRVARLDFVGPP
jgi:pimeloyl-ACP methyl ester carboxylesterase